MLIQQDMMVSWEERDDAATNAEHAAHVARIDECYKRGKIDDAARLSDERLSSKAVSRTRIGRMIAIALRPVTRTPEPSFVALVVPSDGPMVELDPQRLSMVPSVTVRPPDMPIPGS